MKREVWQATVHGVAAGYNKTTKRIYNIPYRPELGFKQWFNNVFVDSVDWKMNDGTPNATEKLLAFPRAWGEGSPQVLSFFGIF